MFIRAGTFIRINGMTKVPFFEVITYKMVVSHQKQLKNLDPLYDMDLDFWKF